MIKLKYGNTNTFYIPGVSGGLLVDTDYAGTLQAFYRALKYSGIGVRDITCVLATHYHPDHMGLVSELARLGVKPLAIDAQIPFLHYSDRIFARDGIRYYPIDAKTMIVISCKESREFLSGLGIKGEIIRTPSHSEDSVTLVLDDGDCFIGDLEHHEYIEAYGENQKLKDDWEYLLSFHPKRVFSAHAPERILK